MSEASLELWEQLVVLHQALDEAQVSHQFTAEKPLPLGMGRDSGAPPHAMD
ncbi:MAG: hypothetical protein ACSLFB_04885 [Acidimicrobiales bacterium]